MKIPLGIKSYTLPDNAGTVYGFKYGPLVLAAELGADDKMTTYQIGVQCDVCQYKIINGEERKISSGYGGTSNQGTFTSETLSVPSDISVDEFIENIEDYLVRDGDTLNFTLNGTDWSGSTPLKFSPYYRIHDQRYGVYWLFSGNDPEQVQERILSSKESGRETNVTLSGVGIGYGSQTEGNKDTYPCMEEAGNGSVGDMGALTRYAKAGGSFSYLFKVDKTKKNYITCQYSPEDNGKTMVIKVGDTVIATDKLDNGGSEIYFKKYEIPDSVVAAAEKYSLKDDTTGTVEERDVIRISFSGAEGEDSPKLHKNAYTSTNYDNNAGIASIKSDIGTVEKVDDSNYKLVVPLGTAQVQVTTELADKYGLLYVEGALVDDTKAKKISLSGGEETVVNLQVYAEDHETKADYKLSIVKKAEASVPAAEKVEVSPAAKTMTVGETLQLKATVSPAGASQSVTYKSGNEAVASVDASGKVTAKKAGTAEIVVASAENANVKATCKITVKEKAASVAVTSIKLSKKSKSMSVGEKFTLKATVSPANASNKAVEFKSSNVKAVSVGKTNGVVTAKKKGTATITATSKANAKVKATCKITVKKPSLKVSGPAKVKKGKSITLKATLKNLKGTVKWSVDKKKIATVKGKGKKATLKGKKAGTVKVTVKVGSVKVTKKVKVSK